MQALSQLVIGQPQACEEVAEALTT